jgi:hypothetical protein
MKTNSPLSYSIQTDSTPRFIALTLLVGLLLGTSARGHAQPADKPAVSPAGAYMLVSVDGKTVPCTINHEGTAMDVHSGSFTITTNGQCFSLMIISHGDHKNIRCETHATYTLKGTELTMQWQNAGWTKGSVAGRTFTMTNEDMAFVYRK